MAYDKVLLESWWKMEDWGTYLDRNGALNRYSSKEGFDFLERKYYRMVKERIEYCKKLLKEHEDAFIHFTLAELYDRSNLDEAPAYLYKRPVRYHTLRALEFDPKFTPAKELLDEVNEWIEFIGGDRGYMPDFDVPFGEEGE